MASIKEEDTVIVIEWNDGVITEYPVSFVKEVVNWNKKEEMTNGSDWVGMESGHLFP